MILITTIIIIIIDYNYYYYYWKKKHKFDLKDKIENHKFFDKMAKEKTKKSK
jgi:hypothetical protein